VAREVLDAFPLRCEGDVVDVADLRQFLPDEFAAAVAVEEDGDGLRFGQFGDCVGDVRPLDGDGVLDAVPEQREHVGASLDDDDGVGVDDAGAGREALVFGDVLDANGLSDFLDEVTAGADRIVESLAEQRLRALDDFAALCGADVLDFSDLDGRATGTDAVDGLQCRPEDGRLDLVEACRDGDAPERLAVLGVDFDVDAADFRGVL